MGHGLLMHVVGFWLLASIFSTHITEGEGIGVNCGLQGDNLPPAEKIVAFYKYRGIQKIRLFDPNIAMLNALRDSGIHVILGILNQDLEKIAGDPSVAAGWVQANIVPFTNSISFKYICAGNRLIPSNFSKFVLPAMQNLDAALQSAHIYIPVTTAIATTGLAVSYPPSQGAFSWEVASEMASIASFLQAKDTPLLVTVYPYYFYTRSPKDVRLDYALFTAQGVVVQDGALGYTNLFDAIVDAMYSALEKAGGPNVKIVVSETGWPSAGGDDAATVAYAEVYNNNVIAHANSPVGTPKRPGKPMEVYLFAMFNENQKPAGVEQNWGLFRPDMTEVYHVNFNF